MTKPTTPEQQREQIAALIDTTHRQATQIDELYDALDGLHQRLAAAERAADDADNRARRAEDTARDAGYTADDAKRTAERAADDARSSARGY